MTAVYLWEIFVNLIESTIVAFLLFHRLTLRNSNYFIGTFISFILFLSALISYCNLSQINSTITRLVYFLFHIIFVSICFKNTFAEKAFTSCLPTFMGMFADQITYTIALIISANNLTSFDFLGNNRVIATVLYLFFIFISMIVFMYTLNDISSLPKRLDTFLVITTVTAIFVSTFFLNIIVEIDTDALPMKYKIQLNSISIFILLVFLAMLFLIQAISKTFRKNITLTEQIYMHEKNEERNKSILQSAKNLRKWKHDYSNHLAVIHELLETESYEQLNQYVIQQRESLPKAFPIVNTGHPILDAILTDKYAITQAEHISFMYSVVLPKHFPLNDIEITGIIGNLLDNSIEACMNIEKIQNISPEIKIILKPQRSMFHIHVENSSPGNYQYDFNGQFKTTKPEAKHHGSGIANVKEIVETHSGFCNITAEKDFFTVDIYIPLLIER